jgi:tRNA (mo5U34)-methyltransferase
MTADELKKAVDRIQWFQRIDLGHGIITPGVAYNVELLNLIRMPDDLTGKRVLDIGANDGFFAFEAERRGATDVLALDSPEWGCTGYGTRRKDGFELARRVLNSKVRDVEMDVFDISPDKIGSYDLVLFLGVLYHLRHPLLGLERVASVTRRHLIVETAVDMFRCPYPAIRFYPGSELNNDPTNWWGPNPAAVKAMLKTVGFQRVEVVHAWYIPTRWRAFLSALQGGRIRVLFDPSRAIVHAWK